MATSTKSTEWMIATGNRLKDLRSALKLSQEELSESINVTRGALANWECGSRMADIAAMKRLAERYGVSLDWIYLGDPSGLPHHLAQKLLGQTSTPSEPSADATKAG